MYIEIETEDMIPGQIVSRKDSIVYFTLEQPALMFTDQSRYPLQFKIRHAFTQKREERDQIGPIRKGQYALTDAAFSVGRFGSLELANLTVKCLRPVSPKAVEKVA
ncbi:MAG: hypothetical protein KGZ69_14845 [Methylomonas sp.]|nr:hypothetical protein [Methylomonas sp.]